MNLASAAGLPIKENECPLVEKERSAGLDRRAGLGNPGFQLLDPLKSPRGNPVLATVCISKEHGIVGNGVCLMNETVCLPSRSPYSREGDRPTRILWDGPAMGARD